MRRNRGGFAAAFAWSLALAAPIAAAQKSGDVLIMSHFDSPASMSMHEEATGAVNRPMMGVFDNLVMYRQDVAQNSMASIVPDLATGWSWNEEGTELTLPLRPGARWHDGKPFTAKDVRCTWDLLTGRSAEKLRLNPRKTWYSNLEEVTANGEYEVTFRRPVSVSVGRLMEFLTVLGQDIEVTVKPAGTRSAGHMSVIVQPG
jgi:peptide/nickel transport system substrate-binding protein